MTPMVLKQQRRGNVHYLASITSGPCSKLDISFWGAGDYVSQAKLQLYAGPLCDDGLATSANVLES